MIRGALFAFFLAGCASASPALTTSRAATESLSGISLFQQREGLLFRTGYRLVTGNAEFCAEKVPATGMLLHDAASYGAPDAVRSELGLIGDIGVQAVADGSPADAAGIRVNTTLIAIGPSSIAARYKPGRPDWKRLAEIREHIDAALFGGRVALTFGAPGTEQRTVELAPVMACASRFELLDDARAAKADGQRVMLGQNFPAFGYGEDEFAAAVAHELAHNLLGHVDQLDRLGRKQSNIRLSERDADRLMPWLLANAGYDPEAAIRFMATWGPKYGGGLLRKRTHDGWDERVALIREEILLVKASVDASGKADWKGGFRPMLGTAQQP